MATTEKTHTQSGSTQTTFDFTFPYLKLADIKVSVNGVAKTYGSASSGDWYMHNATNIKLNTAPSNGDLIRIYRETDDSSLKASFFPGSAIRAGDLNDNFTQNLYTTQESSNDSTLALNNSRESDGDGTYTSAIDKASTAVTTANTASTNASSAVTTANAANATAGTAETNATTAVNTANTASTNATAALNNSRESDGSGGYNSAISIANTAKNTADTSAATVAASAIYQVVANYAALPSLASVDNGKFYQVSDSTNIENSFSDITGEPAGYTGHSGLSVKLKSNTTASPKVWEWQEYYANDPETRYRKKLIVENLHTIDENYTIGTNNNAFSVGPVVVAANKTVTIPANSLYFIG